MVTEGMLTLGCCPSEEPEQRTTEGASLVQVRSAQLDVYSGAAIADVEETIRLLCQKGPKGFSAT